MKDLIEMGLINFNSARFRGNSTNLIHSGIIIFAKFEDPAPDPLPHLISITQIQHEKLQVTPKIVKINQGFLKMNISEGQI